MRGRRWSRERHPIPSPPPRMRGRGRSRTGSSALAGVDARRHVVAARDARLAGARRGAPAAAAAGAPEVEAAAGVRLLADRVVGHVAAGELRRLGAGGRVADRAERGPAEALRIDRVAVDAEAALREDLGVQDQGRAGADVLAERDRLRDLGAARPLNRPCWPRPRSQRGSAGVRGGSRADRRDDAGRGARTGIAREQEGDGASGKRATRSTRGALAFFWPHHARAVTGQLPDESRVAYRPPPLQ